MVDDNSMFVIKGGEVGIDVDGNEVATGSIGKSFGETYNIHR